MSENLIQYLAIAFLTAFALWKHVIPSIMSDIRKARAARPPSEASKAADRIEAAVSHGFRCLQESSSTQVAELVKVRTAFDDLRKIIVEQDNALCVMANATEDHSKAFAEASESHQKLIEGHIRAAEAIVTEVGALRTTISEFASAIKAPPPPKYPDYEPKSDIFNPESPTQEQIMSEFEKVMRGMHPDQAAEAARAEEEKKTMISAADMGETWA